MDEFISKEAIRNALYEADAITMNGVAIINQFSAANVKPVVRGEWRNMQGETVPLDEEGRVRGGVLCTVCGDYLEGSGAYRVRGIFCPNCGVDMRKEENDEQKC